jgi:L-ascorbate metabolism protein UlaG (beta-lactamase superfamily)
MSAVLKPEEEIESNVIGASGTLTWLGHATVLLTTQSGTRIIFDPWIENPKSPIVMGDLGAIDAIAVTHGHFDHMGSVMPLAATTGATVVCVPEMAAYFSSFGVENLLDMNKGGTVRINEVALTMVGADHSCGLNVGADVPYAYGGNPVGYVATLPAGEGGPVYISGDTNVFGDMGIIRDLYAPEICMMPIDGHYNMGPREAAFAVNLLGVSRMVPYHYGTFPLLTGTPSDLRLHVENSPSLAKVVVIQPGQSVPLVG